MAARPKNLCFNCSYVSTSLLLTIGRDKCHCLCHNVAITIDMIGMILPVFQVFLVCVFSLIVFPLLIRLYIAIKQKIGRKQWSEKGEQETYVIQWVSSITPSKKKQWVKSSLTLSSVCMTFIFSQNQFLLGHGI